MSNSQPPYIQGTHPNVPGFTFPKSTASQPSQPIKIPYPPGVVHWSLQNGSPVQGPQFPLYPQWGGGVGNTYYPPRRN